MPTLNRVHWAEMARVARITRTQPKLASRVTLSTTVYIFVLVLYACRVYIHIFELHYLL